jgi:hypothetical protein
MCRFRSSDAGPILMPPLVHLFPAPTIVIQSSTRSHVNFWLLRYDRHRLGFGNQRTTRGTSRLGPPVAFDVRAIRPCGRCYPFTGVMFGFPRGDGIRCNTSWWRFNSPRRRRCGRYNRYRQGFLIQINRLRSILYLDIGIGDGRPRSFDHPIHVPIVIRA